MAQRRPFWPLAIADSQQRPHSVPNDVANAPPIIRGYWLDEEVMKIAGIESASIIMKMKWVDAVRPSHVAIKPKGRRRAWSARNVLRALIVVELARLGRMSYLAAAKIIGAAYVDHLDRLLRLNDMLGKIEECVQPSVIGDTWFSPFEIENPAKGCALVIDDWTLVFWSRKGQAREPLARIEALEKKEPEVRSEARDSGDRSARVRLTIALEPILDQFLDEIASKAPGVGQ